jgi:hypothetical protein
MNLTSDGQAAGIGLFESSSSPKHHLGERFVTPDGRVFRYAKVGGSNLVAGNVLQSPAQVTAHQNLTPVAAAVGATSVTVALGATAATAGQYAGGWAVVTVTPNLGGIYAIKSHPAAALSTSLTLELSDPIRVAWTTSTRVDLYPNPYNGVIQAPATTLTGAVCGVAPWAIPTTEYGWVQVGGPAAVLLAGTVAVGAACISPSGTAGAAVTDPADASLNIIGYAMTTGASGETNGVFLNILS